MKTFVLTAVTALFALGCAHKKTNSYTSYQKTEQMTENQQMDNEVMDEEEPQSKTYIYFAGGCFWGTEHFFKQIRGVLATEVGYANGNTKNPTYEEVCTDATGFAEAVHIKYDPNVVSLDFLVKLYFVSIDPTSYNRQGNDRGSQYRTGVYYTDPADRSIIKKVFDAEERKYSVPLEVELLPLKNFYTAEEYHQDYLEKNPQGYCHLPSSLFEYARKAKQK